jgi:hypothetical protein
MSAAQAMRTVVRPQSPFPCGMASFWQASVAEDVLGDDLQQSRAQGPLGGGDL